MRYYSEDVVDSIIDDAIQYGIDIDAGGTGERPFASHYPSVSINWHTGTPTEIKGWFLFKYRAYGKFVYRTVENPVIDIFEDSELEWQKIEPYVEEK